MNILRMQYFVDVARLENMTKAAQLNYISQTAMSQQIANIERELEIKLFMRDKGRLKLTEAGRVFYNHCEKILELYNTAVQDAQNAYKAQFCRGTILVGVLTSTTVDFFEEIIASFSKQYPDISIKLVQCSFSGMRSNMENGLLDCILCPEFNAVGLKNTQMEILTRETMGLIVSRKNPLAAKDSVTSQEIKDEKIIMTSPEYAGTSYKWMLDARARAGYVPNIVETVDSAEMLTLMVALNRGSVYLPEKRAIYDHFKCKMLRISDTDDISNLVIAWRTDSEDKAIRCFIRLTVDFFKTDYDAWIGAYQKRMNAGGK